MYTAFERTDNAGGIVRIALHQREYAKSYLILRGQIGQDGEMMKENPAFHI